MDNIWIILYKDLYLQLFPVQFALVKTVMTVKFVSKVCLYISNPRRTNRSTGLVKIHLGSVEQIFYSS